MATHQNVSSMTGFATQQSISRAGTLTLELRSVNSKYLDLYFRIADDLRHFEPLLREQLSQSLSRGKVECKLVWSKHQQQKKLPKVDIQFIKELGLIETNIRHVLPNVQPFNTSDILNWPGVFEDNSLSQEELHTEVTQLCIKTINDLKQNRYREGQSLVDILKNKITSIEQTINDLKPKLPTFILDYENKIREKVNESIKKLIHDNDLPKTTLSDLEDRIKYEVAAYSVRIDVQEEVDRLQAHCNEITHVIQQGGVIGKRLDFMCQELNREANTLGSKAHALAQTQCAIDLKVLIEQCREQVQNIE